MVKSFGHFLRNFSRKQKFAERKIAEVKNRFIIFLKMCHPRPLFPFILVFSHSTNTEKILVVSWLWTQIVGAEGENADHYTTTTAHFYKLFAVKDEEYPVSPTGKLILSS